MTQCFFVSDIHGDQERYRKLFSAIAAEKPQIVFLGGDLLPCGLDIYDESSHHHDDFINDFLVKGFSELRNDMGENYPDVFLIMGNDDARADEPAFQRAAKTGVWHYAHYQRFEYDDFEIYGYSCVPPTPFLLKDWERYDVSRFIDPGDVSPEEGWNSTEVSAHEKRYSTITEDLKKLIGQRDLSKSIFLFHAPPYKTKLDRCANDGKKVDHVPLDLHVGSIAIRRLIEKRQPLVTLHGHIHESCTLSGSWKDTIRRTVMLSAAHDGPELALVKFYLDEPGKATRELV